MTPEEKQQALTILKAELARRKGPSMGEFAKEAIKQPLRTMKDFATNPVTQAKALPYLAGTAGALSGLPMGTTAGTAMGRGISDLALQAYGRPEEAPSIGQQAMEVGGAALGDLAPIPFMHKARLGKQIGQAEEAAGLTMRPAARYPGPANAGKVLNDLEAKLSTGRVGPQAAKDAYEMADYIAGNPSIVGKSNGLKVAAARVRRLAQQQLNAKVLGRGAPAFEMAKVMKIPNTIRNAYQSVPSPLRKGIGYGVGVGLGGGSAYELIRKLMGG